MRELHDYFTVAVDQLYEGSNKDSSIIKLNDAWVDPEEETRFVYKRLYGELISGPMGFSDQPSGYFIPVGIPEPKAYVSGDAIQTKVNVRDRLWGRKDYNPSTFEGYEAVTLKEYAQRVEVKQGEIVYFDELVTERENFLGMNNGKMLFRCRVDHIICVIREQQIKMQGSWLLVEPVMETWEEITTESGIIAKVAPEGKPLQAWVKHGEGAGRKIIYVPDSNWGVTVEGQEYFGIREKEVLCYQRGS